MGGNLLHSQGHVFQTLAVEFLPDSLKVWLGLRGIGQNFRDYSNLVEVIGNNLSKHL